MKFRCDKAELLTAVSNVSRAVSGRSAMPVLEGIQIKAYDGMLTLTGYDIELGITTSLPAQRGGRRRHRRQAVWRYAAPA